MKLLADSVNEFTPGLHGGMHLMMPVQGQAADAASGAVRETSSFLRFVYIPFGQAPYCHVPRPSSPVQ